MPCLAGSGEVGGWSTLPETTLVDRSLCEEYDRILMTWTADQALRHWEERKLLTKKKAQELRASLPDGAVHMQGRAIGIFTALGAILMGLGVILFVSSHWQELSTAFKTGLLLVTTVATGLAGYMLAFEGKRYEKTGIALLFLNVLVFGASIFLVAQIYHLPMELWWGALLWCLGTAYFAYVLRSRLHLWLAVPLLVLFVGWLRSSQFSGGNELGFLVDDQGSIIPALGFLGLSLTAASLLHGRFSSTAFAAPTLLHWGLFLTLTFLVIGTVHREVFFGFLRYPTDAVGLGVLGTAVLLSVLTLALGKFETAQGKGGLVAMALFLSFTALIAEVPRWLGFIPESNDYGYAYDTLSHTLIGLHIVHILLTFVFCLTVIWFGSLLRRPVVINLGMIAVAFCILIQYFSWAFELLPRSFAFILGGAIILVLGFVLERQRRRLLASATSTL